MVRKTSWGRIVAVVWAAIAVAVLPAAVASAASPASTANAGSLTCTEWGCLPVTV
ncbi:MAG: hypothetical protein V7637_5348 [Mycobacteriales bacterium]|jgi:hypothetical protein